VDEVADADMMQYLQRAWDERVGDVFQYNRQQYRIDDTRIKDTRVFTNGILRVTVAAVTGAQQGEGLCGIEVEVASWALDDLLVDYCGYFGGKKRESDSTPPQQGQREKGEGRLTSKILEEILAETSCLVRECEYLSRGFALPV
jgi:hypothetical protein